MRDSQAFGGCLNPGKRSCSQALCVWPWCGPGYREFVTHILFLEDNGVLAPFRIICKYIRQGEAGFALILQRPLGWRCLLCSRMTSEQPHTCPPFSACNVPQFSVLLLCHVVVKVSEHSPHQSQPRVLVLVRKSLNKMAAGVTVLSCSIWSQDLSSRIIPCLWIGRPFILLEFKSNKTVIFQICQGKQRLRENALCSYQNDHRLHGLFWTQLTCNCPARVCEGHLRTGLAALIRIAESCSATLLPSPRLQSN